MIKSKYLISTLKAQADLHKMKSSDATTAEARIVFATASMVFAGLSDALFKANALQLLDEKSVTNSIQKPNDYERVNNHD